MQSSPNSAIIRDLAAFFIHCLSESDFSIPPTKETLLQLQSNNDQPQLLYPAIFSHSLKQYQSHSNNKPFSSIPIGQAKYDMEMLQQLQNFESTIGFRLISWLLAQDIPTKEMIV